MLFAKLKLRLFALAVSVLTAGAFLAAFHDTPQPQADNPEKPAPRAEAPVQTPADLALVPGESLGFIRISVKQLWDMPILKGMRAKTGDVTVKLLSRAESALGVPIDNIERVTAVALGKDDREPPNFVFIFTTAQPYSREKVQKAVAPGGTEDQFKGKPLFTAKDRSDQMLYLVDDHTFITSDKRAMEAYLGVKADAKRPESFERALKLASGRHHIVAWFHVPEPLAALAKQNPLPEEFRFLRPLLEMQSGSLTVDFANEARARLSLRLPDEDSAKEATETLRAGLDRLKDFMKTLPGKAKNDAVVVDALLMQAMAALKDTQVVREQSSVVVTVRTGTGSVLSSVIPSIGKIRTAASRAQSIGEFLKWLLSPHVEPDEAVLKPLAEAGVDLEVVIARRQPRPFTSNWGSIRKRPSPTSLAAPSRLPTADIRSGPFWADESARMEQ